MIHSEQATRFVAAFEGLRTEAYLDQRGIPTIAYGHTLGVKMGDTCTGDEALAWLDSDLLVADKAIGRLCPVPLTQNQYDALTSLVFNIGQGNFDHSTVLACIIRGEWDAAANAFLMWNKVNGATNAGLDRRRQAERLLFLKPEASDA